MKRLPLLFRLWNCRTALSKDPNVMKTGDSVYQSSEWSYTRAKNFQFYTNPTDSNYFHMIFQDADKILSTKKLCDKFDFSSVKKIGDIGGLPFSQSWTIHCLYPHLKFTLTDYDEESLNKHLMCLPMSREVCDIMRFDAKKDNLKIFSDCDLLTMWGVDYALADAELLDLLSLIKQENHTLLLATVNIERHFLFIQFLAELYGRASLRLGLARDHGKLRRPSYIRALCDISNVSCETIFQDQNYSLFKVN